MDLLLGSCFGRFFSRRGGRGNGWPQEPAVPNVRSSFDVDLVRSFVASRDDCGFNCPFSRFEVLDNDSISGLHRFQCV